jgi:hypothetical protein
MSETKLTLSILPGRFAVCRLSEEEKIPAWANAGEFFSITRTAAELSIVCQQSTLPREVKAERDWRCLKVEGPLDFSLTGIFASLAAPLATAQISLFAISTFDTDYLLVKQTSLEAAIEALRAVGHQIKTAPPILR